MDSFKAALSFKFGCILANLNKYRRDNPLHVVYKITEKNNRLWIRFYGGKNSQSISLPIPDYDAYDNYVLGQRVVRSVGTWYHGEKEYTYWKLMAWLLTGRIETAFPNVSKRSQLERLILSFDSESAPLTFRSFQDMVDGIINKLPLTGTPMETWAMCNRMVILDPSYDSLPPAEALEYQKDINKKFFPWSSIGLSDSGMVNNNLLKTDLRCFTPFGVKHHNPMRNLYQTLGMKGDEPPLVQTRSALNLAEQGVERWGWNLMTCFLDTPLNFEDQLILDVRHLDKFTLENRRFVCFGKVQVSPGETLEEGAIISMEPNGKPLSFWVKSDRALVLEVSSDTVFFNGQEREVTVVYIETKHTFKEGIKLINCHGNKGVVSFADCGVMFDAGRDNQVPIDIIVSARTISKRRNYGQVLETLLTLTGGPEKRVVIPDDAEVDPEKLGLFLSRRGYNEEGTSLVRTQWFEGEAICGWSFWGLIKNPENQLWTKPEVLAVDNRGRRTAGIKVSHIELRGLTTIFGPQSPVIDEILSYQQGFDDILELVNVLEVLRGKSMHKPLLDWSSLKPLMQSSGYFHLKAELNGTIVDEDLLEGGFMLQLPRIYQVFIPDDSRVDEECFLLPVEGVNFEAEAKPKGDNIFIDKIYVPTAKLRACWQHPTARWGLSDIGGYLNNIVLSSHRLVQGEVEEAVLLRALNRYFRHVSTRLSTKKGEIATYALAVRYPHSAKATATLAKEGLPQNWIEIHTEMAEDLQVSSGDHLIVERFPCLGFKSLRIQRVQVTNDPQCRFVIRVSGNSLVSQNLDFDGDVLFLMAFNTPEAQQALAQEYAAPDAQRKMYLDEANAQKVPCTQSADLDSINITSFPTLTAERQVEIVSSLTGVKRGTGAVVALAYNLMRIIEGCVGYNDKDTNLAMEVIMDKVANSVFEQKHAGESLEERCKEAICTANLREMLAMGFPETGSKRLCQIIREEAQGVGVTNLESHYRSHQKRGHSNIVNLIVRKKRKFYFATRANLSPVRLLEHLDSEPTDLTSHLWHRSLRMKERKSGAL